MRLSSQVLAVVGVMTITAAFAAVLPEMLDGGARADEDPAPVPEGSERTQATLTGGDGATIPITVYRPLATNLTGPVPVLLHSHGWSGTRTNADGAFAKYVAAGFGVVSIDMRGHGASDCGAPCVARVHNVDYEIMDVMVVIDYVATLPWVLLDAPGDPVIGALGGSYGGGYQLLTAIFDDRLDAIAPEITWNSLPQSLAPNGGIKSAWVDLLYGATWATGTHVADEIHAAYAEAMATNRFPDGSGPTGVDIVSWFTASSPASYPEAITIPTLLIQGVPDTLFNLNQAVANFEQIGDDAPVWLFTHRTGHILSTAGTIPVPSPVPIGVQPPGAGSPCGDVTDLIVEFYTDVLKGGAPFAELPVQMAFDDGTCREFAAWPPSAGEEIAVETPLAIPSAPAGGKVLVPLRDAQAEPYSLAGIPTVELADDRWLGDATVYFSLVALGANGPRTLDAQVTPYRAGSLSCLVPVVVSCASTPTTVDLGGVASVVRPGEALFLQVASWDEQFATNAGRLPAGAVLPEMQLTIPTL